MIYLLKLDRCVGISRYIPPSCPESSITVAYNIHIVFEGFHIPQSG